MMETITRDRALVILANHGWQPNDQTATDTRRPLIPDGKDIFGKPTFSYPWVESGSSFDEMLGIHNEYSKREILDWLGY